jgi:uncharacterized protein (DUF362 family)
VNRVFLSPLDRGYGYAIEEGMKWIGLEPKLHRDIRICIKPNLTFPDFRRGVMTTLEAVEALVLHLKNYTSHITICESDSGGYNRFSIDEVFKSSGLADVGKKYGVRVVNLSTMPARTLVVAAGGKNLSVPYPTLLQDEADLLITLPVPKIHMNTGVSIAIKNHWGLIPDPNSRLRLHPYFKHVIYEVWKAMPRCVAIVDGRYGLNRSGPMEGDPVDLNWLAMSDNACAVDFLCCRLMGIDPWRISYLGYCGKREGLLVGSESESNVPPERFTSREAFFLRRRITDIPGYLAFHSSFLAYVAYRSPLADILHKILYLFRRPFYDYEKHRVVR